MIIAIPVRAVTTVFSIISDPPPYTWLSSIIRGTISELSEFIYKFGRTPEILL